MFEYYNQNTLCVQASWLIEEAIVSEPNYKQLCKRGHFKKVQTGGNGRPALIEFETMRSDIKNKIIQLVGDPMEKTKHIQFIDYLVQDLKALDFFNSFTLDNGDALPEKNIKEYTANASVLNAINTILTNKIAKRKALGGIRTNEVWEKLAQIIAELPSHQWPHSLPNNVRRLKDKNKLYLSEGYQSLVHKAFGSKNAEKINENAKSWVLARWADRVKRVANYAQLLREYNLKAVEEGWKLLKTEQSLQNFLNHPQIEPLWYGYRFGELKSKEKFGIMLSTKLPTLRDSLWYSDGTKLNYYYLDENGKVATMQVYEVMDAYSEVFLGYHISKTEDYEAQYFAYKMAVKTAEHRPYQISFDNQGGHKKLQSGNFLTRLSRLAIKTQPYNGKSKTIESAFGRFQTQFLKQDWFFTGQNITATKDESRQNMEFILKNQKSLPSLEEIKKVYLQRREEWNSAPHPKTGLPRLEMYLSSENPETPKVGLFDMVDLFWIEREKPVQFSAYGLTFTEKKAKYTYWVYDDNRKPDVEWMSQNIDKKFVVKFDPDDMSLIYLYEKTPLGLRFVKEAETKVEVFRGKQDQNTADGEMISYVLNANKEQRIKRRDEMDEILNSHQMTPEHYGLVSPELKGLESSRKQKSKEPKSERQKELADIGQFNKSLSNLVFTDSTDELDIYNKM